MLSLIDINNKARGTLVALNSDPDPRTNFGNVMSIGCEGNINFGSRVSLNGWGGPNIQILESDAFLQALILND